MILNICLKSLGEVIQRRAAQHHQMLMTHGSVILYYINQVVLDRYGLMPGGGNELDETESLLDGDTVGRLCLCPGAGKMNCLQFP